MMVDVAANTDVDYYYAHDHLYSPSALLGSDGTVLERYEYDAYGSMTRLDPDFTPFSGTEVGNPYYFTGRRVDVLDSGNLKLQYSRNRYYDTETGRFLTHDPLGYSDGMNSYEYVSSRPNAFVDPMGLLGGGVDITIYLEQEKIRQREQAELRYLAKEALRILDKNLSGVNDRQNHSFLGPTYKTQFYPIGGLEQLVTQKLMDVLD